MSSTRGPLHQKGTASPQHGQPSPAAHLAVDELPRGRAQRGAGQTGRPDAALRLKQPLLGSLLSTRHLFLLSTPPLTPQLVCDKT